MNQKTMSEGANMYRRVADFWIEEALCSVAVQVVAVLQVNHARGVVLQDGMFYTELRQDIGNLAKLSKIQPGPGSSR